MRQVGRRKLIVNGKVTAAKLHVHNYMNIGAQGPTLTLFERAVNRLDKAGFKYVEAYAKGDALIVHVKFNKTAMKFVCRVVTKGELEGQILLLKPKCRTAGMVRICDTHMQIMIDMCDAVPSMALEM